MALSSVAVLTVAALVGTDRGLASAQRSEREQVASRAGAAAGDAYVRAQGSPSADLGAASAIADAAGARLVVHDTGGVTVWPGTRSVEVRATRPSNASSKIAKREL